MSAPVPPSHRSPAAPLPEQASARTLLVAVQRLARSYRGDQAVDALAEAQGKVEALGTPSNLRLELDLTRATVWYFSGRVDESVTLLTQACEAAGRLGLQSLAAECAATAAVFVLQGTGMIGQVLIRSIELSSWALTQAQPNDHRVRYRAFLALAIVCQNEGALDRAFPLYERALAEAKKDGDDLAFSGVIARMALVQAFLAMRLHAQGALDDEVLKQAIVGIQNLIMTNDAAGKSQVAFGHVVLANLLTIKGDYVAADALFRNWRDPLDVGFDADLLGPAASAHAICRFQLGDPDSALALCERARTLLRNAEDDALRVFALANMASVLTAAGDQDAGHASRVAREALSRCEGILRQRQSRLAALFQNEPLASFVQGGSTKAPSAMPGAKST